MTFNEYQAAAISTAIYPPEHAITYTLGNLCAEAGEANGKYMKWLRDSARLTDEDWSRTRHGIGVELGDALWQIAAAAHELGFTLEEIAECNNKKLHTRKVAGTLTGSGDNR